jgi:hypothetical protein
MNFTKSKEKNRKKGGGNNNLAAPHEKSQKKLPLVSSLIDEKTITLLWRVLN